MMCFPIANLTIIMMMFVVISSFFTVLLNSKIGWLYVQPISLQKDAETQDNSYNWLIISSGNEYLWMLITQALILLTSIWSLTNGTASPSDANTGRQRSAAPVKKECCVEEKTAWQCFLMMNILWYLLALIGSAHRREGGDDGASTRSQLDFLLGLLGGKAAWPAMWDLAMVLFPIQRFVPFIRHDWGVVAQQTRGTQLWHIWCGHACVMWLFIHALLLSCQYYFYRAPDGWHDWWILMTPYFATVYTEGHVNFAGWISFFGLILLWGASRPFIKQAYYEVFVTGHVIGFAVFVFFANLHDYCTLFFIQPALATHAIDWVLRTEKNFQVHLDLDTAGNENMNAGDHDKVMIHGWSPCFAVIQLSLPIPLSWPKLEPGMVVKLSSSCLKNSATTNQTPFSRCRERLESWHSFSISHVSLHHFTIYVKNLGDWTNALIHDHLFEKEHLLMSHGNNTSYHSNTLFLDEYAPALPLPYSFSLTMEGPYLGSAHLPRTLNGYSRRIFLAGGVGMAGMAAFVQASANANCNNDRIFWWVNTFDEYKSMSALLLGVEPNAQVFVTGECQPLTDGDTPMQSSSSHATNRIYVQSNIRFVSQHVEEKRVKDDILVIAALVGSFIGLFLSLFLARMMCAMESYIVGSTDASEGDSYKICTLFSLTGKKCVMCNNPHGTGFDDDNLSCCPSISCFYCFRSLPMILSFFLVPLGASVVSFGYKFISRRHQHLDVVPVSATDDTEAVGSSHASNLPSMPPCFHSSESQEGGGEVAVPEFLKFGKPSISSIVEGLALDCSTVVVACGSEAFVSAVQKACPSSSRLLLVNHPT